MPVSNVLKYDGLALAIASGDVIKLVFYSAAAAIDATTPAYTATNEVTQPGATPAINAKGVALTGRVISASDGSAATASVDWDNLTITPAGSSFVFQKILIINTTRGDRAVFYHDYLSPQTFNAGTTYTLAIPDSGVGLVRIG